MDINAVWSERSISGEEPFDLMGLFLLFRRKTIVELDFLIGRKKIE